MHRTLKGGETARWREYELKIHHLPGQTLFAMGLEVVASEKFRLIVQTASRQPLDGDARFMLKQRLMGMYDRAIDLSEHFEAGQPDDHPGQNRKDLFHHLPPLRGALHLFYEGRPGRVNRAVPAPASPAVARRSRTRA